MFFWEKKNISVTLKKFWIHLQSWIMIYIKITCSPWSGREDVPEDLRRLSSAVSQDFHYNQRRKIDSKNSQTKGSIITVIGITEDFLLAHGNIILFLGKLVMYWYLIWWQGINLKKVGTFRTTNSMIWTTSAKPSCYVLFLFKMPPVHKVLG